MHNAACALTHTQQYTHTHTDTHTRKCVDPRRTQNQLYGITNIFRLRQMLLLIRLQLDTLPLSPPPLLYYTISCPRFPWKLNLLHNYAQTMLLRVICSYL